MADTARCLKSRSLLHTVTEDTRQAETRLVRAQQQSSQLQLDIAHLRKLSSIILLLL